MKIAFSKTKEILSRILQRFGRNLFMTLILLLVLDLVLAGLFFWHYYLKVAKEEPQAILPLKINQALVQKFSSSWQEKEELFRAAEDKQYLDIFNLTLSEEEEGD